jgi:hypothetical protein
MDGLDGDPPIYASHITVHAQLMNFLPRMASNYNHPDLPDLCLPSSWDYSMSYCAWLGLTLIFH